MYIDNTHVYDVPEVLAMLDDIVAQFPEDHTAQCYYFNPTDTNSDPICIVGQVLHRLGVTKEDLGGHRGQTFEILCRMRPLVAALFTESARRLINFVQFRQDEGGTWKEAVEHGRESIGS